MAGDGNPLPQAEFVAQFPVEMATLRNYRLTIHRGAYRLTIDEETVLQGPTRNYDLFGLLLNPFNKPNIINIGDASFGAGARGRLGPITIETCRPVTSPPTLQVERGPNAVRLAWESVPGARYTVQAAPDLETWTDLHTFTAHALSASFLESVPEDTQKRFYRICETLPAP